MARVRGTELLGASQHLRKGVGARPLEIQVGRRSLRSLCDPNDLFPCSDQRNQAPA